MTLEELQKAMEKKWERLPAEPTKPKGEKITERSEAEINQLLKDIGAV